MYLRFIWISVLYDKLYHLKCTIYLWLTRRNGERQTNWPVLSHPGEAVVRPSFLKLIRIISARRPRTSSITLFAESRSRLHSRPSLAGFTLVVASTGRLPHRTMSVIGRSLLCGDSCFFFALGLSKQRANSATCVASATSSSTCSTLFALAF